MRLGWGVMPKLLFLQYDGWEDRKPSKYTICLNRKNQQNQFKTDKGSPTKALCTTFQDMPRGTLQHCQLWTIRGAMRVAQRCATTCAPARICAHRRCMCCTCAGPPINLPPLPPAPTKTACRSPPQCTTFQDMPRGTLPHCQGSY